jgi:hypothetical protein
MRNTSGGPRGSKAMGMEDDYHNEDDMWSDDGYGGGGFGGDGGGMGGMGGRGRGSGMGPGASGGMLQDDGLRKDRRAIQNDDDFYQQQNQGGRGGGGGQRYDKNFQVAKSERNSYDSYDDQSYTSEDSRSYTESEYSSASSNGFYLPEDEVYEIFDALDANGDGEISHAEFIKGLKSNPM